MIGPNQCYDSYFNADLPVASPDAAAFSMSILDLDWEIARALNPDIGLDRFSSTATLGDNRWSNVNLLQLFIKASTESIHDSEFRQVMRTEMIRLCFSVSHFPL